MLKKGICVICFLAICLVLASCSNGENVKNSSQSKEENSNILITNGNLVGVNDSYYEYSFTAKNNSGETINTLTLHIAVLDKEGNILEASYPQEPMQLKPEQSITISSLCKKSDEAFSAVVDGYDYYCNGEFIEGFVDDSPAVQFR